MSADDLHDFTERLRTLDLVVKLGWGLIAGAFCIGVWVATIQIGLNRQAAEVVDNSVRLRALELRDAANEERLKNILTIVDRIDRRISDQP